jgi:hypothetical protein
MQKFPINNTFFFGGGRILVLSCYNTSSVQGNTLDLSGCNINARLQVTSSTLNGNYNVEFQNVQILDVVQRTSGSNNFTQSIAIPTPKLDQQAMQQDGVSSIKLVGINSVSIREKELVDRYVKFNPIVL